VTALAPTLQAFFTDRLMTQRHASPHTIACYRDTFRLLLGFIQDRRGIAPSQLTVDDLDADTVTAFLQHLEHARGNQAATRNIRLAAIRSFFHYAALHHPEHAALISRVLAIPGRRTPHALVAFLSQEEIEALLASPDRRTWVGRRDHTLLLVAVQTGMRISELIGLTGEDVQLGTGPYLRCHGKGRKERVTPLTRQTAAHLHAWLREHQPGPAEPLFPSRTGGRLSRDAIEHRLGKYATFAARACPSLRGKRLSAHVLRHSAAMTLLQAGADLATIALWLGHEDLRTVQAYLHADLAIKERALARTTPPNSKPGRYRPSDALLAFLDGL
jgi:integrase/recombinase XerD